MANFNRVFLMGNLTRDIELRHTNSNQAVATIGLAVNRRWRTPDGEDREEVTFVDCEAWGKTAETMSRFLAKGRPVFIEGRLKLDQWEKEGQKFSKLKVVVENFQFIDSKPGGGEGGGGGGGGGGYTRSSSGGGRSGGAPAGARSAPQQDHDPIGDDIPF
ncbi:MAG: single-stranded DNA-binding protein [Phycisphaeraceae bacterium]|nr:single-stranded DNA-binding protein [Phycisphaeraceae bacterium]MCW5767351.1 single-stranded DNA-binding protein [Phycisphaeraceae bacterium]